MVVHADTHTTHFLCARALLDFLQRTYAELFQINVQKGAAREEGGSIYIVEPLPVDDIDLKGPQVSSYDCK